MESIINKFEKDKVNMSQIYGGSAYEYIDTGRGIYGSSTDMNQMGSEYAIFNGECFYRYFQPDNGGGVIYIGEQC